MERFLSGVIVGTPCQESGIREYDIVDVCINMILLGKTFPKKTIFFPRIKFEAVLEVESPKSNNIPVQMFDVCMLLSLANVENPQPFSRLILIYFLHNDLFEQFSIADCRDFFIKALYGALIRILICYFFLSYRCRWSDVVNIKKIAILQINRRIFSLWSAK